MPGPTTSDLIFSEQVNHNFSKTLGELKRSTLSILNRLQSIQEDAAFAQKVAEAFGRPLVANERCGSWYIDPKNKAGSAYFKSTDGHTGVWKFSSRRLNLHLLEIIGKNDGCIIVDSTRRGKRMPDALSKTIPIWCAVLNRFLFPDLEIELHTPPQVVARTENAQMQALLPQFLKSLQALDISTTELRSHIKNPLRPIWVTPESKLYNAAEIFTDSHPVICCTVSRRVTGGEASEGGYIQGAGDDTENWAHGLTAPIYWENKEALHSCAEGELEYLIESLVRADTSFRTGLVRAVAPTSLLFVSPLSALLTTLDRSGQLRISLLPEITEPSTWHSTRSSLEIGLGTNKIGSRNLRLALPTITTFISSKLKGGMGLKSDIKPIDQIFIACESGKDFSIGVALALLCLFFDDHGTLLLPDTPKTRIDKAFIRRRLGWISLSMPDANPSRATLQSVNSFLMQRP